ncbi:YbfB/YjiJ family MFS transporter [Leucobacter tardus]|nr:MFS transporter [Leucobacter tardus]
MTETLDRRTVWGLTLAGASLIAACYGLARFSYGLFVPVFRTEFDFGAAAAGALASGSYAAYCAAIIAATLLTPRFGGRAIAVAAGATATIGTLAIAVAPNTLVLALGVIVAGASTGVASPPLAHAVARSVDTARQSRVQTVINAGTGLGVAIAGPIALLTHDQWRAAWIAFAALSAAVTLWTVFAVPRTVDSREAGDGAPARVLVPRPLFPAESPRLVWAALLLGAASAAVWTFGRDLLVSAGGMSETASTICWILLGALGIIGAIGGDLVGALGLRATWMITVTVLALSTVTVAIAPTSVAAAGIALGAFGAAYIAASGLLLLWGTRVYDAHPAAGVGLGFLVLALGQTLAAPALGGIGDLIGLRWAFAAAAGVGLFGALACAPRVTPSPGASSAARPGASRTPDPESPARRA